MTTRLGTHAIVIGAGISGLAAAKALSTHFEKVTILERDVLPDGPEARIGTPQCRQVHTLIRGGVDALRDLFPGIETELERAGAFRAKAAVDILLETPGFDPWPQRDFGFGNFYMTRPLVEYVTRCSVMRTDNIRLLPQRRVTHLIFSADSQSVSGACYALPNGQSHSLDADFVVDASSRGGPTLDLLDTLGMPRPQETEIGIDVRYATAMFEIPQETFPHWRGLIHRPDIQRGRGAFLFPVENNRWQTTLYGLHGDSPPDDLEGFVAFASTLRTQTFYDAIKHATPLGDIHRFGFPSSIRRRFEALESFPAGLIPIGDAICRFNPAFGQGMTVALQEVGVLKHMLDQRSSTPGPFDSLATDFFAAIQSVLATPWSIAESDFVFAKTRGTCPTDLEQRLKFGSALQQIAMDDADVHRLLTEVNHLMKPGTALREPHIVERVMARMA